jgi:CRISPR-associated protein Csy2
MSQFILINRIKVQNANAIAGFTWGFPAITHFLGFTHNLARKLATEEFFDDITLAGCAVISHEQYVHTYRSSYDVEFTQSRNPPYLASHNKANTPPVIEEGKMNMTVSLLIGYEGNIGNRQENFIKWLAKTCLLQRLAGGTILSIKNIETHTPIDNNISRIKRKLLPGFVLQDRSSYLEEYYLAQQEKNKEAELLGAWFDFIALKQKARPKSDLINKHFQKWDKTDSDNLEEIIKLWQIHLQDIPYQQESIPHELKGYFNQFEKEKSNEKLLQQWQEYCFPTQETQADWEYIPKPETGYLVPIMTGYKAISPVYKNIEIANTRDSETDVCFVESAHSIGEWQSIHRLKTTEELNNCLWHYHYEENWYLCKQNTKQQQKEEARNVITTENPDDDFL